VREYFKRYLLEAEEGKKPLDFKVIDSLQTAVMYIHSFLDLDHKQAKQKFGKFLKASFRTMRSQKLQNLVIDVRHNSGGNLSYVNELFYQIATKEYRFLDRVEVTRNQKITDLKNSELSKATLHNPNRVIAGDSGRYLAKETYYTDLKIRANNPKAFQGKVYLLVGKRSFSASSHLAVLIEAYKRGTIVGEETGGSCAGFNAGDIINIGLPITNLQLEVPMEKCVKIIPRYAHKNGGVVPHHEVANTIEDEITGFDRVLDFTLRLIKKGGK
jgi:C-terminal processing protease CtpA/Prc